MTGELQSLVYTSFNGFSSNFVEISFDVGPVENNYVLFDLIFLINKPFFFFHYF